jgi:hypothetical protein
MNHQPFREWLLSDEHLSDEQSQALQDHLASCDSCRQIVSAWKELEVVIQKSPHIEPASSFTERWQEHLAEYHLLQQTRSGWLTISGTILIATSLLILFISQFWSLLQAPDQYLAMWLNRLIGVVSIYYTLQNIANSFSWNIPVYTFVGMFFLVGIISFMSVLWLATYRKFSMVRRAV